MSPLLVLNKGPGAHSATKQWQKEVEICTHIRQAPLLLSQEMERKGDVPDSAAWHRPMQPPAHWHRRGSLLSGLERKLTPALLSEGGCSSKAITVMRV